MKKQSVLCVDDEIYILNSLKRILHTEDIQLFVADNSKKALEIIKDNDIRLVISDYMMPDMLGTNLLQEIRKISPQTVRVILSGHADTDVISQAIEKGDVHHFLSKPWTNLNFKEKIRNFLEQAS